MWGGVSPPSKNRRWGMLSLSMYTPCWLAQLSLLLHQQCVYHVPLHVPLYRDWRENQQGWYEKGISRRSRKERGGRGMRASGLPPRADTIRSPAVPPRTWLRTPTREIRGRWRPASARWCALTPKTVELIPTLGARSPPGGPVQDLVLTANTTRWLAVLPRTWLRISGLP